MPTASCIFAVNILNDTNRYNELSSVKILLLLYLSPSMIDTSYLSLEPMSSILVFKYTNGMLFLTTSEFLKSVSRMTLPLGVRIIELWHDWNPFTFSNTWEIVLVELNVCVVDKSFGSNSTSAS